VEGLCGLSRYEEIGLGGRWGLLVVHAALKAILNAIGSSIEALCSCTKIMVNGKGIIGA